MPTDTGAIRLGATLERLRESKGFAVDAVAKEGGFEPAVLRAIESGERLPRAATLRFLARKYGEGVLPIVLDLVEKPLTQVTPPVGAFSYGHGRNEAEAEQNLRLAKAEQVPYYDFDLPADTTAPEFTAALLNHLDVIEHCGIIVNTILRNAPAHLGTPRFRLAARLRNRDIVHSAESVKEYVTEEHEKNKPATPPN